MLSYSAIVTNIMLGPEASLTGLVLFFFFFEDLPYEKTSTSKYSSIHGCCYFTATPLHSHRIPATVNPFPSSCWITCSICFAPIPCDYQYFRVRLINHFTFSILQGKFVQAITEECIQIRMETTNPHGFRRSKFLGDLFTCYINYYQE